MQKAANASGFQDVNSAPARPPQISQLAEPLDQGTYWPLSRLRAVRPGLAPERLVYRSRTTEAYRGEADFQQILKAAVRSNSRNRITGALALSDNVFVQVLEGPAARLDELLVRLRRDSRHTDMDILGRWGITRRLFTGWSMAHSDVANACPALRQRFRSDGLGLELVNLLFDAADSAQPVSVER